MWKPKKNDRQKDVDFECTAAAYFNKYLLSCQRNIKPLRKKWTETRTAACLHAVNEERKKVPL